MQQPSLMMSSAPLRADKAGGDVAGWLLGVHRSCCVLCVISDVGKWSKMTVFEKWWRGDMPPKGAAFYQLCVWDEITLLDSVSCGSMFYSYMSK